jgi:hypothetical protein
VYECPRLGVIKSLVQRQRLNLSIGPNRSGVLPENGDKITSETTDKIKIMALDYFQKNVSIKLLFEL